MTTFDEPATRHAHLPLHGIRVLECGDALANAYAGRLLVELGADVVKVECAGGDPLRTAGPFTPGGASVPFAYYHAGKRLTAVADHDGGGDLRTLVARADVVVRCTRDGVDVLDDGVLDAALAARPELIVADISTFGRQSGDRSMSDLLALAASGLLLLNVDIAGDPLRYRGELASVHAACAAVLAVVAALDARLDGSPGRRIDVSAQAAIGAIVLAVAVYTYTGELAVFGGIPAIAPWGFFDCADGTVLIMVNEDVQWVNLRRVLGDPAWAAVELFDTNAVRREQHDIVNGMVAEELAGWTLDDIVAACRRANVPASRVHTAADVVAWPHLHERGWFTQLAVEPGAEPVLVPGAPWRFERTDAVVAPASAPRADDAAAVLAGWPARAASAMAPPTDRVRAPLQDHRVVDMTWVWAGPYSAMQFAHLGADVVKVESEARIDVTRILNPFADDVRGINRSGYFNQYSQGKRSIAVDVTDPAGHGIVERIIAGADVVMDNMRPGAMHRLGFGAAELAALRPELVAVAMSGFGEDGPERDQMAYGAVIDALCGTAACNGQPGSGPTFFPMSMPDPGAGIHAAIAAGAAMYRARRTGVGDRVQISMTESTISAFPWPVLLEAGGAPVTNVGNRDDTMSPHGAFPCAGDRRWIAVLARDDTMFAALAGAIGRPDLAGDERFATLAARKVHEDELEAAITAWTSTRAAGEAAALLDRAGVACAVVATIAEVMASPHLAARRWFNRHPHPEVGVRALPGAAWTLDGEPQQAGTAAPCLGQHTAEVLGEVLAMAPGEIAALRADGVVG